MSAAAALDAADGVMDGRFHGRPIVGGGYGAGVTGGALTPYTGAATFGGYGAPTYGAAPFGATAFGASPFGYRGGMSPAAALDAADGVMDGKINGRPIVGGGYGAGVTAAAGYPGTFGASPFGYRGGYSAVTPSYFGGAVGGGFPAFGGYAGVPATSYAGFGGGYPAARFPAAATYGASFARPAYAGVTPSYYGGAGYGAGFGAPVGGFGYAGSPFGGNQAAAAQLDAADGVMDGKFYGSQVVA